KLMEDYHNREQTESEKTANEIIPEASDRVKELRQAHRTQWLKINKTFGWEVIDIRYGGLINRLDTAMKRINDFINNKIDVIDELEQERLPFSPNRTESTSLGW